MGRAVVDDPLFASILLGARRSLGDTYDADPDVP
jgi:hypothetical protein